MYFVNLKWVVNNGWVLFSYLASKTHLQNFDIQLGISHCFFTGFPACCFNKISKRSKHTSMKIWWSSQRMRNQIQEWVPAIQGRPFVLCKMTTCNNKTLKAWWLACYTHATIYISPAINHTRFMVSFLTRSFSCLLFSFETLFWKPKPH